MLDQEQERANGVLWVLPWGQDQGDYVRINASDFDPALHLEYSGAAPSEPVKPAAKRKAAP